jgi:sugar O-acyltransferase (sialic acid O-acetyltransferase NeuD family)
VTGVVDVYGAGGHAKVVLAALDAARIPVGGVFDVVARQSVLGHAVRHADECVPAPERRVVVAIGNNLTRRRVVSELSARGHRFATLIHPHAWVAPGVFVGEGAVIFAGAVVQPDAVIGEHAILNTGCSVDHDCVVGAFAHVAPGARLAGDVHVGEGGFVGIGAVVIPGRRIGAWATVGAGAAVVRDVEDGVTVVGVPALPLSAAR